MTPRSLRFANTAAIALFVLGGFQMTGQLLGIPALRGIGAATVASPSPNVFGTAPVWGEPGSELETFSARFDLLYELEGEPGSLAITPAVYQNVRGPYNRRNVYGAALAYGPCLPPELVEPILEYALATPGTLRTEIGLPKSAKQLRIRIRGEVDGKPREWILQPGDTR